MINVTQDNLKQFANIKVIGVGGGGGNAINRMIASDVQGVEFWAINTDIQALSVSLAEHQVQIGTKLTKGLGGGAIPSVGEQSAKENKEDIEAALEGADMVFITAGMGGGTGTGASPSIARTAKDLGALTIAVVTKPFRFEGPVRNRQAEEGIEALREHVDAMIIIPNDKILSVIEKMTSMINAFKVADDVLRQGVQGIADLITIPGLINLDFADVKTIMKDSGSAMMGIGQANGEGRAIEAAKQAISSPLLEETIDGATGVILNITGGDNLSLHEVHEAADVIYNAVDPNANILFGSVVNESLKDDIQITVIATGFNRLNSLNATTLISELAIPTPENTAPLENTSPPPLSPLTAPSSTPYIPITRTPIPTEIHSPPPSIDSIRTTYTSPPIQEKSGQEKPNDYKATPYIPITNQGQEQQGQQQQEQKQQEQQEQQIQKESTLEYKTFETNGVHTKPLINEKKVEEFDLDVPAFLRNIN